MSTARVKNHARVRTDLGVDALDVKRVAAVYPVILAIDDGRFWLEGR